jgi:hypothetical protein
MGKHSRAKLNRPPAPVPRLSLRSFSLSRSTWVFVLGVLTLTYGAAGMQYSRWNHAENARVLPVFHPWAIVVGIVVIVLSYRMSRPEGRR